ncbi:TonB-dependent receptor [Arcticibacter tournemirensis]|uniref:TonB-dependent receptor n=2 Tax=Arcticibacter tournemirensis TaxID=699437 RepID=A0A5M9H072_9SPHI|nr:TonB-dependent receptor [Arcticibacter tournemirensis]
MTSVIAQERTVTGTVKGREDGLPLPGVSVRIKGAATGTQTGANGQFSITVPGTNSVLVFTYIGYTTQEVAVGSKSSFNVLLVSDTRELGEVIVTANAIKREKRTLGYSAPSVNTDELTEGRQTSAISALQGKVAGVNITSTASTPGSSSRVVLRGGSSISGSNQALIVVDGVPIDNSSVIGGASSSSLGGASSLTSVDFGNRGNDINPNDIASITVLKGPAAAALYGSRASNGALIITTKSGNKGANKTEVNFTTSNTFSSILKLPDFQNEYGQGYFLYDYDADGNPLFEHDPKENWSWGAPFNGEELEWGQQINGVRLKKPYVAQPDNIRNFFDTGFASDNNLSFSGGGEKTTFYLGLNSLNSDGVYPSKKDDYNRYSVRFNGTSEFANNFYAGINFNYIKINSNQVAGGQGDNSVYDNVLQTPRDIPLDKMGDLNNPYYGYGYTDANGVSHSDQYGYSLNSDGVYPSKKDDYNRYSVRFNGTSEFANNFYAGINFNYIKINSNQVAGGQGDNSVYDNVLQTPRDIPLDKMGDLNNPYYGYGYTDANGVSHSDQYGYYGAYAMNPYWVLENYDNYDDLNRVTGNFNIGYKPVKWLDIKERLGVDTYSERRRIQQPKFTFAPIDNVTKNYSASNTQRSVGLYEVDQLNVTEIVHDLMVTASHKFNEDFEGSLMVGNNIRSRSTSTNLTATNTSGGLVVPGWYNLANSNGPVNVVRDYMSTRRLVGLYADLNLGYKNMLFFEATARNDWSSTLPQNNYSFFYPSVSTSFVFSELLKNSSLVDVLNYGKLRASWAQVGNDTDPYQLLTTFSRSTVNGNFGSTTFPFGNVAALMAGSTIGNPSLKPEKTSSFEVGTELGFLQNRISLDFSYYSNNSKDQILSIPIPNSTGYGFKVVNAGEVQNKGIELSLRLNPIKTSYGLNWELYGTYTRNKNKVVELMDGVEQFVIGGFSGMSIVAAKGRTYGEFFAVTDATDAEGRTIVDSETGIPVPTDKAVYLGSYNPKYLASLGTNLKYKNWSLNALFDTKKGGVFFSRTKDIMAFVGTSVETGGPRVDVVYPNSVYLDDDGNSVVNTDVTFNKQDYYSDLNPGVNVIDASYVKLRNLSLSYQFQKEQLKGTPFGALTIGLYGNNLFLWTPSQNKYADPEVNSAGATNEQGFDYTAQPSVRNYGFNVSVSF